MQGPFNRYLILLRRWAWVLVLGIVVCGGTTLVVDKSTKPAYQATAMFVVNAADNSLLSIAAAPTYAQLLTNPLVLNPVVAQHREMTLQQLNAMITVKSQTNTELIELDIQSGNPFLAAQVANEIGQSYLQYVNSHLSDKVQMLPAQVPSSPVSPKPLQDTSIAALIGLGLAVTLIVVFQWAEDRLSSPENAQELLALELLTTIPQLPGQRKSGGKRFDALTEKYRTLAASLNTVQAIKPFKVMMITSALPKEGKSTVAANLATFLAMASKRVLLIDANLHNPVLDQHFQLDNCRGLSAAFLEMWSSPRSELYGQETELPTLRVLTSGTTLTGSTEFLQSSLARQIFKHLQETPFDYVVVDAPPLLSVADAQILAALVQAVLLVVDANKTPRRALLRMKRVLEMTHTRILGIALNKSPWPDYGTSQRYPTGKIQRHEDQHRIISPAMLHSQSAMPMPPFIPSPSNWSKVSDVPSDGRI